MDNINYLGVKYNHVSQEEIDKIIHDIRNKVKELKILERNVVPYVCTHRYSYKTEYIEYRILDICRKYSFVLKAANLKYWLKLKPNLVANLKLTSDNKLIVTNIHEVVDFEIADTYDIISLDKLTEGYICAEHIFYPSFGGKDSPESRTLFESKVRLIVGYGYVLNQHSINEIKKYYSGTNFQLKVLKAKDVREQIAVDPQLRYRLAAFYANEMRNSRYFPKQAIESEYAKKAYNFVSTRFLTPEFLKKDVNLLYMLFVFFGHHAYTFEHSVNVGLYACCLYSIYCKGDISYQIFQDIFISGLLHDLGKLSIDVDSLIDKPTKLTPAEWGIMSTHAEKSREILEQLLKFDSPLFVLYKNNKSRRDFITDCVEYHHKYYKYNKATENDKFNYPNKTLNYKMELAYNKFEGGLYTSWYADILDIITISDKLDAQLTPRLYRPTALGLIETRENLSKDADKDKISNKNAELVDQLFDTTTDDKTGSLTFDYGVKISKVLHNLNFEHLTDITKELNYVA